MKSLFAVAGFIIIQIQIQSVDDYKIIKHPTKLYFKMFSPDKYNLGMA